MDIEHQFSAAMAEQGLAPEDRPVADGQLHRFRVQSDKRGSKNGWYCLFGDGTPAGIYGSWKSGGTHTWCSVDARKLSYAEQRKFKARMADARRQRDEAKAERQKQAASESKALWDDSVPASSNHPYLDSKRVQAHRLRQHGNVLLVPLYFGGKLVNLQKITADGRKFFMPGGRVTGAYHPIGMAVVNELHIAEGFATGATLNEMLGVPVACAMNCGNLLPVAKYFRRKYPNIEIIIDADNDDRTDGNPGVTHARVAATAVAGRISIPKVTGDWNDAAIEAGLI